MKTEQLQKANELKKIIDDYKSRVIAVKTLEDVEESKITSVSLKMQVFDSKTREYCNAEYGTNNSLHAHIKDQINEEIEDCAHRIKRIFDKEIKKLEKEFESL